MSDVNKRIEQLLKDNKVMLFMKGTPSFPQCGFSARAVAILNELGAEFGSLNVLEDQEMREGIKAFGNWPTIPQLYINQELVGGSDIMLEMYEDGELKSTLEKL
ncbi:MAG: monothiol glutaredoxin, Grx4 family [Bdellovibrionaceae bacterium]|nr:monothiol glutaredoxin, Grx4 family [Pseudobdellovibrionaceae bacterium]